MCAKSSPTGRMRGSDYEEPPLARFPLTLVDALGESDRPLTRTRDDRFATVPIVAPTAWPWPPAIPELWVPYNRRLCPTPATVGRVVRVGRPEGCRPKREK